MQGHLSWLEAIVIGLIQGVSELFPVSSLGHSVLLPAVIGGSWARDLDVSAGESPYLAFIVGLHVATAIALVIYFWRDWVRVIRGLVTSIVRREVADPDQRLAWLLILGTIPVGLAGLLLEHTFRAVLAKPVPTAVFLVLNGVVLLAGEHLRRRVTAPDPAAVAPPAVRSGSTPRPRCCDPGPGSPARRRPKPCTSPRPMTGRSSPRGSRRGSPARTTLTNGSRARSPTPAWPGCPPVGWC